MASPQTAKGLFTYGSSLHRAMGPHIGYVIAGLTRRLMLIVALKHSTVLKAKRSAESERSRASFSFPRYASRTLMHQALLRHKIANAASKGLPT